MCSSARCVLSRGASHCPPDQGDQMCRLRSTSTSGTMYMLVLAIVRFVSRTHSVQVLSFFASSCCRAFLVARTMKQAGNVYTAPKMAHRRMSSDMAGWSGRRAPLRRERTLPPLRRAPLRVA
jgi:hypothetical protein